MQPFASEPNPTQTARNDQNKKLILLGTPKLRSEKNKLRSRIFLIGLIKISIALHKSKASLKNCLVLRQILVSIVGDVWRTSLPWLCSKPTRYNA